MAILLRPLYYQFPFFFAFREWLMPLNIHLRKSQRIIINGAVIENVGAQNASLRVMNNALVLRDSDVLTPEDAVTPASRAYYALQCLYLFPEDWAENLARFRQFLDPYVQAAPSAKPISEAVLDLIDKGKMYQALKKGQELINHEHEVFAHVQERLSEKLQSGSGSGELETN
ncbi:MAG: flagellar biosynthesis repressor FlbT [Magnetovibrionaceae bacterium]